MKQFILFFTITLTLFSFGLCYVSEEDSIAAHHFRPKLIYRPLFSYMQKNNSNFDEPIKLTGTLLLSFASPNGSNDVTTCGSESNPCSLPTALNAVDSDGSVILLDGVYHTCALTIVQNISLVAQNSGKVVLDCLNLTRAFEIASQANVSFTGITFLNGNALEGGAILANKFSKLTIHNCSFINNTASYGDGDSRGGAISALYTLHVTNSVFINNSASAPERNPTGNAFGGAIFVDARYPGIQVFIGDCLFEENSAAGGQLLLGYPNVDGVYLVGGAAGGAIDIQVDVVNTSHIIANSIFNNNLAKGGDNCYTVTSGQASGGAVQFAIYALSSVTSINNCTFFNNSAIAGSCASISSLSFGGGITYLSSYPEIPQETVLAVTNSQFIQNNAFGGNCFSAGTASGGGIIVNSQLFVKNCSFVANLAAGGSGNTIGGTGNGGAVYVDNSWASQVSVNNSVFANNTAVGGNSQAGYPSSGWGGAIDILNEGLQSNVYVFSGVVFTNNTATGGAGHARAVGGQGAGNLYNFASKNRTGGGLNYDYLSLHHFNSTIFISDSSFTSNYVYGGAGIMGGMGQGGGCSISLATKVWISNTSFTNNVVVGGDGPVEVSKGVGGYSYGGGLCVTAPCFISDSVFTNNEAKGTSRIDQISLITKGGTGTTGANTWDLMGIDGGDGGNACGGAIYATLEVDLSISGSIFTQNKATGGRGGIPSVKGFPPGTPGFHGRSFGGAIASDVVFIRNSEFTRNSVGENFGSDQTSDSIAGAIAAEALLSISDCNFTDNSAYSSSQAIGGAVLSAIVTVVDRSNFSSNTANSKRSAAFGGALFFPPAVKFSNYSTVVVNGSQFRNNVASGGETALGGALFFNNTASMFLEQSYFMENNATYGGAVFLLQNEIINSTLWEYNNTNFQQNFAAYGGGATFISSVGNSTIHELSTTYENNFARYGNTTASDTQTLTFISPPPSAVWPGQEFTVQLALLDSDLNIVIQPFLYVLVSSNNCGFISGTSQDVVGIDMDNGLFVFEGSTIIGSPGSNCSLIFRGNSEEDPIFNFTAVATVTITNCPPSTYITRISSFGFSCQECQSNQYNFDGQKCVDCPKLTDGSTIYECVRLNDSFSNTVVVKQGYYPYSHFSNPSKILACPSKDACNQFNCYLEYEQQQGAVLQIACGGLPDMDMVTSGNTSDNSVCAEGYEDRLCSKCVCNQETCYFSTSDGHCVQCEKAQQGHWILDQLYILNAVIVFGVMYIMLTKAIPSALVRGLWFFVQTSFILLVPEAWPDWLFHMRDQLPFVASVQIYSLQCVVPPSWNNPIPQFLIAMSAPFALTSLLIVAVLVIKLLRWIYAKFRLQSILLKIPYTIKIHIFLDRKIRSSTRVKIVRAFLLILNLTFFTLSVTILQILQPCDKYDSMIQYPWINCHSTEYHTLLYLAIVFFFLYVVGIPAIFGFMLVRYRHDIIKAQKENEEQYLKRLRATTAGEPAESAIPNSEPTSIKSAIMEKIESIASSNQNDDEDDTSEAYASSEPSLSSQSRDRSMKNYSVLDINKDEEKEALLNESSKYLHHREAVHKLQEHEDEFVNIETPTSPLIHYRRIKQMNFLFQSYTSDVYWFEVVWIARRLLIAVALYMLPSTLAIVATVTFVLTFGIGIQNWLHPYKKEHQYINTIEIIGSVVIILTYNIGYHIKEFGSGTSKEVLQLVFLIMNGVVVAGILLIMILQLTKASKKVSRQ